MIRVKGLSLDIRADLTDLPPLLLLHGLLSSRNHWALNQQRLRRHFRLIVAELPGHGRAAPCTDAAKLHPDALAHEIDAARRALGLRRWYVCGQSFASGITLRHALQCPDTVAAQVWTNGNRVLAPAPTAVSRARDAAQADAVAAGDVQALRALPFHPVHGRRFPDDLRARLVEDADGCDIATVAALMRHTLPDMPLRARFGQTRVPTLLVNGRLENRFQPSRAFAVEALPEMAVTDLPGGHAINIERPEAFDEAVIAFLAAHPL